MAQSIVAATAFPNVADWGMVSWIETIESGYKNGAERRN